MTPPYIQRSLDCYTVVSVFRCNLLGKDCGLSWTCLNLSLAFLQGSRLWPTGIVHDILEIEI